jgi:hypothetical protein
MFKFELGQVVKEKITGFTGVIMGRTDYITGCKQYGLLSQKLDKTTGKPLDWHWFDEERLVVAGKKISLVDSIGGPQPAAPSL